MEIQNDNGNRWMKNKIRRNVSLDQDTIDIIEAYSLKNNGEKNLSSGIRTMARSITFQSAIVLSCPYCKSTDIDSLENHHYKYKCNYCTKVFS